MTAPHILLVVLDTLRRDHLSTYGYQRATAPALDDFAGSRDAVRARHLAGAVDAAGARLALHRSLPGRASAHPGGQPPGLQHPTLAEILRTAGWQTAAFCNNPLLAALDCGLQRGFTNFYSYAGAVRSRPTLRAPAPTRAWRALMQPAQRRGARSTLLFRAALRPRLAPLWTRLLRFKGDGAASIDDLCDYLRQQRAGGNGERQFTFVNLMGAHLPWQPARASLQRIAPASGPQARRLLRQFNARAARWSLPPEPPLSDEERQALLDAYDAEILQQDAQLGRLLRALQQMNALADTLVIIVADHGEAQGDHGYMGHSFGAQQELVHVPLIIHDPAGRCAAGQRVAAAVSTRRIFHTALAAAGLPAPLDEADPEADVAELTLARAAEGRDSDGPVFSEAWPPETLLALLRRRNPELLRRRRLDEVRRAMHSGRHKLLLCGAEVEALYDLQDDPLEQQDLAAQQPQLATSLRRQMLAALPAARPESASSDIDATVAGTLRALGYIE